MRDSSSYSKENKPMKFMSFKDSLIVKRQNILFKRNIIEVKVMRDNLEQYNLGENELLEDWVEISDPKEDSPLNHSFLDAALAMVNPELGEQLTQFHLDHSVEIRMKTITPSYLPAYSDELIETDQALEDILLGPISFERLEKPFILVGDGHTYEKEQIERHLENHSTSPMTNEALNEEEKQLMENTALLNWINGEENALCCPLTDKPFQDPVILKSNGCTYEREAIAAQHSEEELIPNRVLADLIEHLRNNYMDEESTNSREQEPQPNGCF
jgi:hypothetical protein